MVFIKVPGRTFYLSMWLFSLVIILSLKAKKKKKKRSSAPLSHQITAVCKARPSIPEASVYGQQIQLSVCSTPAIPLINPVIYNSERLDGVFPQFLNEWLTLQLNLSLLLFLCTFPCIEREAWNAPSVGGEENECIFIGTEAVQLKLTVYEMC